ncbi:MAG: BTAD domain-containing putative transcriptional regulator [Dehalococcoidia bacterium]
MRPGRTRNPGPPQSCDHDDPGQGFHVLVHQVADPTFAISLDGRIADVNAAAEAFVGTCAATIIGRACSEVIGALDEAGERVCRVAGCPILECFAAGNAVALNWEAWQNGRCGSAPVSATALTVPRSLRNDGTVAIVTVHPSSQPAEGDATGEALDIDMLGPTRIARGTLRIARPPRRKSLELLGMLAVARPTGLHREQIMDALWPGEPAELTAGRLRVVLHDARRLLAIAGDPSALDRDGAHFSLEDTSWLRFDFVEFDAVARDVLQGPADRLPDLPAVERLLDLYRGEFGADEDFGDWAIPYRESLRRRFHDVLSAGARLFAQRGAIARSVECCERALRSDPLQEQFHHALIAYYGQLGRRTDAIRQYEDYREILATELGEQPSPATERVFHRALSASTHRLASGERPRR